MPTVTVYAELIDAIKRHMPMQYEQLDDIQQDDVFLLRLLETVDKLPLTFSLSKGAEKWFNSNRDHYNAAEPITAPDGFVSVVPSDLEISVAPANDPEPEQDEPEPVAAASGNGKERPAGKQARWTDEARAQKAEQMRQWQAKRQKDRAEEKEKKAAEAAAAAAAAAAQAAQAAEKPRRRRLQEEPAVEASVAPEPRGRLPLRQETLIEPEPEMSGRLPLVAKPPEEAPAIKEIIKPRVKEKISGKKRTPPSPTSRMCQVYAELLKNGSIPAAELCDLMNQRGIDVALATVKVAKSTLPNFVEAAKLAGHWTE